jgi:hypothetical protein
MEERPDEDGVASPAGGVGAREVLADTRFSTNGRAWVAVTEALRV